MFYINHNVTALKNAELLKLPPENKISSNKRNFLLSMIDYMENPEHRVFSRKFLGVEMPQVNL